MDAINTVLGMITFVFLVGFTAGLVFADGCVSDMARQDMRIHTDSTAVVRGIVYKVSIDTPATDSLRKLKYEWRK